MSIEPEDINEYPKVLSGKYSFEIYNIDGELLAEKNFQITVIDKDGNIMK